MSRLICRLFCSTARRCLVVAVGTKSFARSSDADSADQYSVLDLMFVSKKSPNSMLAEYVSMHQRSLHSVAIFILLRVLTQSKALAVVELPSSEQWNHGEPWSSVHQVLTSNYVNFTMLKPCFSTSRKAVLPVEFIRVSSASHFS